MAELYDRFGRVAYGLALRIVRDPALAEDAVQEGFMAVWRSSGRFVAERAKASTWILTLSTGAPSTSSAASSGAGPSRSTRRRKSPATTRRSKPGCASSVERVQEALKRLPDKQREALELAYYGGFTQSELADRLGEPLGTIKSRMFSGLASLRELLAEEEFEEEQWNEPRSTS